MNKQHLRKLYLKKRMDLSPAEYDELNSQLVNQFSTLNFEHVNCIHLFLPILEKLEPNTFLMIDWLKNHHPEIKRAYPKADFANSTMTNFCDDSDIKVVVNTFGIPEPISGNEVSTTEIDIMIVPLLSFDKQGYRVGYGKGFYDRFMTECKPGTQFIGISFFEAIDAIDDVNQFDIPLHKCILPHKIWNFIHSVPL